MRPRFSLAEMILTTLLASVIIWDCIYLRVGFKGASFIESVRCIPEFLRRPGHSRHPGSICSFRIDRHLGCRDLVLVDFAPEGYLETLVMRKQIIALSI